MNENNGELFDGCPVRAPGLHFLARCHTRQLNQALCVIIWPCFILYCCLLGLLLCTV